MKYWFLIALIFLNACTSDHYVPVAGSSGSDIYLKNDLKSCRDDSIHKALSERNNDAAVIGGAIGGLIGGVILGAAVGASPNNSPRMDINQAIEKCMASKGYTGFSEHYN